MTGYWCSALSTPSLAHCRNSRGRAGIGWVRLYNRGDIQQAGQGVDEGLKKRLIGATVLVSLVVIFVPMLLEDEPVVEPGIFKSNVPRPPHQEYPSRVVPLAESQPVVTPLSDNQQAAEKATGSEAASRPVQKSEAPRVGLTAWVAQVGSFSSQENADRLIATLREKGYAAFLEQAEVNGTMVFRVKVGPEVDRKLAEQLLERLNGDLKPLRITAKLDSYP